MRVSSYNPRDRYRRKSSEKMAGFMVVFAILLLSFVVGFWIGGQNAGREERSLEKQVAQLLDERETLQDTVTELRAETQTAVTRYSQLQETYEDTLPEGPMRDLVAMLKQQLDEGRSPERLKFLIRSARPPKNCAEPQTKRLVVSTPAYEGPGSEISLAEGALVINASGLSAVNSKGQPEAWYDASKKVTVNFMDIDGEEEKKHGVMPINHSMVVGEREYRMTIAEGARSFAKITYDSCDYP